MPWSDIERLGLPKDVLDALYSWLRDGAVRRPDESSFESISVPAEHALTVLEILQRDLTAAGHTAAVVDAASLPEDAGDVTFVLIDATLMEPELRGSVASWIRDKGRDKHVLLAEWAGRPASASA